jgi:hypothetical protein
LRARAAFRGSLAAPDVIGSAAMPFPCPSCATPIPDVAQAPVDPFSASVDELCLTFDARAGYALIGVYEPDDGAPRLRAYDVYGKRVAWEAFNGDPDVSAVGALQMAVRNGNVYLAMGRSRGGGGDAEDDEDSL